MAEEKVNWVFQDWLGPLTMQMQSVLLLACRGPDTIAKFHPCKDIVRRYRATVLKSAYYGRPLKVDGSEIDFMSLESFTVAMSWHRIMKAYFDSVDSIPHHYHLHLMHGAEIMGYYHPDPLFKMRWREFYDKACDDMHVNPETAQQLAHRLRDWGQTHWEEEFK